MKIISYALFALTLCCITACGGDGGGGGVAPIPPASHIVALKLATSGIPSANLAGIDITVTLPDGVTPALNGDGTVATSVVTVSGVAAPGATLPPVYVPATAPAKGTLRFVMVSNALAGFGAGEFAVVNLVAAPGVNPLQADFLLSGFNPIDFGGNVATGLTAGVSGYLVQ